MNTNYESSFKTLKMYLVTCSCGGMLPSNLGAYPFFKDIEAARQFIGIYQPRSSPEHTGVIHEVSIMVPNIIKYEH